MSGGGKGGSQSTEMSVPDWVEQPARRNLARAEEISQIGYVPYGGPEVAAFTPAQNAAFANNNATANAFGMQGAGNSMPAPQTFAGGIQGYSSLPLYEESIAQLQATRPGQYDAIMSQFIDPFTGARPVAATAATTAEQVREPRVPDNAELGGPEGPAGWGNDGPSRGGLGGYSGIGDMFDGGGPGQSGGSYQGGGAISGIGNAFGGPDAFGGGNGGGGVK